jgi:hypothetical protein
MFTVASIDKRGNISGSQMTVFRDVPPCSLAVIGRRFRDAYCLYHRPDDVDSKHL